VSVSFGRLMGQFELDESGHSDSLAFHLNRPPKRAKEREREREREEQFINKSE
jgi:hypothetical protein